MHTYAWVCKQRPAPAATPHNLIPTAPPPLFDTVTMANPGTVSPGQSPTGRGASNSCSIRQLGDPAVQKELVLRLLTFCQQMFAGDVFPQVRALYA